MKYIQVVAAIVIHDNKIQCVQRGQNKYEYISLKYEFLGGKVRTKEEYQPTLLLNNEVAGQKVLSHILGELNSCEEFRFSVDFFNQKWNSCFDEHF